MSSGFLKRTELLFPLVIFLLSILLYLPSIKVSFLNDEIAFIQRNTPANLSDLISLLDKKDYDGDYYRPFSNLVSGILSSVSGLSETPYRIFNLLLHATNGILLYLFISSLLKEIHEKKLIGLFGALFFIAFPLNDYAVIWHTDLFDRLMTCLYLLSLVLFIRKATLLSLFSFILAILSKEMSFSLPFVILILSYFTNNKDFKKSLLESAPFFLILVILIIFRWLVFNNNIFDLHDAHSGVGLLTAAKNLFLFAGMLIFPFFLRQTQDILISTPQLVYLVFPLFIIIFYILFKYNRKDQLLLLFTLILLVSIIPASRLLMRWYLYLPSAFFCSLLAYSILRYKVSTKWKLIAAFIVFGLYYSYTLFRVTDWTNISQKGEDAVLSMINENQKEIISAEELVFLTLPAKVNDIPLFQLAFDVHLNRFLGQDKQIVVLSKSYLDNFSDLIRAYKKSGDFYIYHTGDNYFILSDLEKSVKFNQKDLMGNKLKQLQFTVEKEPDKIFFTFSDGKFHLIKDYNED